MTKVLEDLVFFVCAVTNNGQDALSVVTSNPNRDRQKLMREQDVLTQASTHVIYMYVCACTQTHHVFSQLFCFLYIMQGQTQVNRLNSNFTTLGRY